MTKWLKQNDCWWIDCRKNDCWQNDWIKRYTENSFLKLKKKLMLNLPLDGISHSGKGQDCFENKLYKHKIDKL